MIKLALEQGSEAWKAARLGIPTASQFSRILTPAKMEFSKASVGYRNELIAEWLLGRPLADDDRSAFMERGSTMEESARDYYELTRNVDIEPGGFILRNDRRAGCSPDGLILPAGGLELKCPSAAVHVGYLLDGPGHEYRCQVQGVIWIAELEWVDFLSYNPVLPTLLVRLHRDDVFIAHLAKAVAQFCDMVDAAKAELQARGYTAGMSPVDDPLVQQLKATLERAKEG